MLRSFVFLYIMKEFVVVSGQGGSCIKRLFEFRRACPLALRAASSDPDSPNGQEGGDSARGRQLTCLESHASHEESGGAAARLSGVRVSAPELWNETDRSSNLASTHFQRYDLRQGIKLQNHHFLLCKMDSFSYSATLRVFNSRLRTVAPNIQCSEGQVFNGGQDHSFICPISIGSILSIFIVDGGQTAEGMAVCWLYNSARTLRQSVSSFTP